MRRSEFTYELPPERIAQAPAEPRDGSRLMVVDRRSHEVGEGVFRDLARFLEPGDLLVANDTKVIPARLRGNKETGGRAEVLLLRRESAACWEALVRSSKRPRPGTRIVFGEAGAARLIDARGAGVYGIRLEAPPGRDPDRLVEEVGEVPLPPYIRRDRPDPEDRVRYQTLFAHPEKGGSAAAPTAGLHFTPAVLADLEARGIGWTTVTLHVGPGTFVPVRTDDVRRHSMHREWYEVAPEASEAVNRALDEGRRIVAVGTTATRVLETCGRPGRLAPGCGWTDLFILPGHAFRVVGGLITNFHLPESTLLMLVCAFGGMDRILGAYRRAAEDGYRFYSYGDAMLIV